jgi:hypothetical protein
VFDKDLRLLKIFGFRCFVSGKEGCLASMEDVFENVYAFLQRNPSSRPAKELNCVFQIGDGIRTTVTSSVQDVFRCLHPDPSGLGSNSKTGVSLEIIAMDRSGSHGSIVVVSTVYGRVSRA